VTSRPEQVRVTIEAQKMKKRVELLTAQEFPAVSKPPTVYCVKVQ